jgi:hypothetical protein
MTMLFNQRHDMTHQSGGWIILAKDMLTNRDVKKFVHKIIAKSAFCAYGTFWDLLFQLMKHGTNTLHVAFILLFIINPR